jgi:hypothetical protein
MSMSSLKRTGMVLAVVAALGVPTTASAFSFSSWLSSLFGSYKDRHERPKYDWPKYDWPKDGPRHEGAVPEPTAALLFGIGAAVVAARARKPR